MQNRDKGAGSQFFKTAGVMLANMAMYTVANIAIGKASSAVARIGVSAIKKLAEKDGASAIVKTANTALSAITKAKEVPTIFDVGRSLGIAIPKIGKNDKAASALLSWGKEQVVSTLTGMAAQNIDALNDGRNLSMKELFIEASVADLGFRGAGKIFKSSSKAIGKTVTKFGNEYWEKSILGGGSLKERLSGIDAKMSFIHNESRNFKREQTVRFGVNPIQQFDAKYGIQAASKNIAATIYAVQKAADTNPTNILRSLQSESRRGLNSSMSGQAVDTIRQLEKSGRSGMRYVGAANVEDIGYKDFTSGMSTLASTVSKVLSFESVPIVNTLFANRFISQNTEMTVYNSGDFIFVGSKGQGEKATTEEVLSRFAFGTSKVKGNNKLLNALKEANAGNDHVQQGIIRVPEKYHVVNSSDGMYMAANAAEGMSDSITRVGHLSMYTGKDTDAGKYVNFSAVSSDSRLAEVVSGSIDKSRTVKVGVDDEVGILGAIKHKESASPYEEFVMGIQGSGFVEGTDVIDGTSVSTLVGSMYNHKLRRQDQFLLSYFMGFGGQSKYKTSAEMLAASDFKPSKETLRIIDQIDGTKKAIETNVGYIGIEDAKMAVLSRDHLMSRMSKGETISFDFRRDGENVVSPEHAIEVFKNVFTGETLLDGKRSGDFVKKLGSKEAKMTFDDILPEKGDIQIVLGDNLSINLRDGKILGEMADGVKIPDVSLTYDKRGFRHYREKRSLKETLDEMSLANLNNAFDKTHNNTTYMMATSVHDYSDNTKHIIGLSESPHDLSNVVTPGDAVAYSAMASVNALARKWGMDVDLDMKDDVMSFLFKIGETGAHTALELGIGIASMDAIMKTSLFDDTRFEGGVLPFLASSFQDVQMFGSTILEATGANHMLKGINDRLPGLINSPLGGGILSIAPLVFGIGKGVQSGNTGDMLKYTIGGGITSAILGGAGSSILGAYDPTMDLDQAYAISTGQEDVAIRKGRFWGLSSGSFWGSQTQYHRGSALFNSQLNLNQNAGNNLSQLTDFIGTTNAYERNIYSRPYANLSGGGNDALGVGGYGSDVQFGGGSGSGLPTSQDIKDATNIYGLRGFIAGDVVLGGMNKSFTSTDMPRMANPEDAYSLAHTFNNANLGGMFGQTEYLRRVLPKRNNANTINPIRNLLPDWMPGSNYMINFKEGDAYAKITDGESRLPGVSNLIARDRNVNLVADLSFLGMLNDEDTINMAVYGNLKNNRDNVLQTTIKNEHIKNIRQISSLNGFRLKENTTYTTNGNVTATADYDFNGETIKVEVVDQEKFESISSNENNIYKNKADLLATISKKRSKYIIINQENGEKIEISGTENNELLRNETQKIHKLAPEIKKKIQETGMGAQNLYSMVDRFVVLSDVAPYSNEFKQYKQLMMAEAKAGKLSDDDLIRVAEAIKKQEVVTAGIYTSTGKPSPLANLLPSKLMNPDDLDPLTVYREENIYSSGMKTWQNPTSYFKDDVALTASGTINPIKRAIGSGILYKTLYGNTVGMAAATATMGASAFARLTGGIEMRDTYDESRDILLKKAALEYKMNLENGRGQYNENNLYSALKYGTGDPEDLAKQLHRDDRIFYNSVKDETDPERQREILESVSPQLAMILEKQWQMGGENSSQYDTNELDSFVEGLDENSILLEEGVNPNYLVMREMELKGIDPRTVGLGYGNQVQEMNLSNYGNLEFADSGKPGELANIRSVLGVSEAVIEGYNVQGDRTITVEIVVG